MRIIRKKTFETNSSSTHSLVICSKDEFEDFKNGKKIYDDYNEKIVDILDENDSDRYKTYDDFGEELEYYEKEYTTPSGDKIVVFGEYGYYG